MFIMSKVFAGMAELADAPDLGSGGRPCRFKSCYPHKGRVFKVFRILWKLCFLYLTSVLTSTLAESKGVLKI